MIQHNYNLIKDEQEKLFSDVLNNLKTATADMVKSVDKSTKICRESARNAEESCERIADSRSLRDWLIFATPFLLAVDILIRFLPWLFGLFGE